MRRRREGKGVAKKMRKRGFKKEDREHECVHLETLRQPFPLKKFFEPARVDGIGVSPSRR